MLLSIIRAESRNWWLPRQQSKTLQCNTDSTFPVLRISYRCRELPWWTCRLRKSSTSRPGLNWVMWLIKEVILGFRVDSWAKKALRWILALQVKPSRTESSRRALSRPSVQQSVLFQMKVEWITLAYSRWNIGWKHRQRGVRTLQCPTVTMT